MKFTAQLSDLVGLLKLIAPRPKGEDTFRLFACAARVFVEHNGDVGGVEALVFEDGAVTLPTKKFRELLKTYKGRHSLTIEADSDGLRIGGLRMSVISYDRNVQPPANFQLFSSPASLEAGGSGARIPR